MQQQFEYLFSTGFTNIGKHRSLYICFKDSDSYDDLEKLKLLMTHYLEDYSKKSDLGINVKRNSIGMRGEGVYGFQKYIYMTIMSLPFDEDDRTDELIEKINSWETSVLEIVKIVVKQVQDEKDDKFWPPHKKGEITLDF